MDLNVLKQLQSHDKIKFVGDPDSYGHEDLRLIDNSFALKKNKKYVISSIKESSRCDSPDDAWMLKPHGFVLCLYKATVKVKDPADWELVAYRHDLVVQSVNNKHGLRGAKQTLEKIRNEIQTHIVSHRDSFNNYLNNVQLPQKMKYLSELEGEDKILADMLFEFEDMHKFLNEWENGRNKDQ